MSPTNEPQPGAAGRSDTATLEERVRALEERLRGLQGGRPRGPEPLFNRLVPPEARRHLRAAQRERLLAVRAFIDAAIKRTEENPQERPRRPESVRIE